MPRTATSNPTAHAALREAFYLTEQLAYALLSDTSGATADRLTEARALLDAIGEDLQQLTGRAVTSDVFATIG